MRYRKLGKWRPKLSAVGLGSWLTYGRAVEKDAAAACVREAYERGVNFFDTANVYARGAAEEFLGGILSEFPRDALFLATKVYFAMGDGPNDRGLSRKHVFEQIDRSLARLRVQYVDLYQCHRFDTETPLDETCAAMHDLVVRGKILYWGVSEWNADQIGGAVLLCRARGWHEPVSNQPQYSALWRRIEDRVLPATETFGLGNVVWSPLAMGVLSGKYDSASQPPKGTRAAGGDAGMMEEFFTQPVLDAVRKLKPIADEAGITVAQLSLAWCLRLKQITSVIVGATKVSQVVENVAAADADLPDRVWDQMDQILKPVAVSEPYTA